MLTDNRAARYPWIVDTTLRDGEQAAGVAFTLENRLKMASAIAATGVQELELGIPAMGREEVRSIAAITALDLPVRTTVWCRAREEDLALASGCGVDGVHLSLPVSSLHMSMLEKSPEWVLDSISRLVSLARMSFDYVSIGAQDASRADLKFLIACAKAAERAGAHRFRIADTVGVLDPFSTHELVSKVWDATCGITIGFHAHNDLGMATANTLAAFKAGAQSLDVTVNGLGERAGNAAMEEVLAGLRFNAKSGKKYNLGGLCKLSHLVEDASGLKLAANKPIVGSHVFSHESGIHVDGILSSPQSYEPFSGSEFGQDDRQIVVGRHSGATSVRFVLDRIGIKVGREEAGKLLPAIRERSGVLGRSLTYSELLALWCEPETGT